VGNWETDGNVDMGVGFPRYIYPPGLVFDTVGIETSGFALRRALWTYQEVKGKRIKRLKIALKGASVCIDSKEGKFIRKVDQFGGRNLGNSMLNLLIRKG